MNNEPIPKKWKGNEFSPGEKAVYQNELVEIISWTPEHTGFWYIKLPNGCPHYTKFLSKP